MADTKRSAIRGLILDMDGVLWRDSRPLADLPALFGYIEAQGWKAVLATNNATRTVDQYLEKLRSFGVALEAWQVINSAQAAAGFLKRRYPGGGPVYIIGEAGLIRTLQAAGFRHQDEEVLAVAVGLDRRFSYQKLRRASLLIQSGALFLGTNPDRTLPTPQGLVPGAGALLAALEAATDRRPVVVGKPAPEMFQQALDRMAIAPGEALVVGDRLETDIAGGQAVGCRTGLVLSGVTSPEAARAWSPRPDYIAEDLTGLLSRL